MKIELSAAIEVGARSVVQAFIEIGFPVDDADEFGVTPLMCAARSGFTKICIDLVRYGANPLLRDGGGKSAADYAIEAGYCDVSAWLERLSDRLNSSVRCDSSISFLEDSRSDTFIADEYSTADGGAKNFLAEVPQADFGVVDSGQIYCFEDQGSSKEISLVSNSVGDQGLAQSVQESIDSSVGCYVECESQEQADCLGLKTVGDLIEWLLGFLGEINSGIYQMSPEYKRFYGAKNSLQKAYRMLGEAKNHSASSCATALSGRWIPSISTVAFPEKISLAVFAVDLMISSVHKASFRPGEFDRDSDGAIITHGNGKSFIGYLFACDDELKDVQLVYG